MRPQPALPPARLWLPLIDLALAEDIGPGDVTTPLVIAEDARGEGRIEARAPLIACGLGVAEAVFRAIDPELVFRPACADGAQAAPGDVLAVVSGALPALLAGERTALNFLARLSGVATHTRRFVDAVAGTGVRIVDTRKTLPGWRVLDKYAVAVGGGENHRTGLYDGILLKDNHIALAGGVSTAVKSALEAAPRNLRVQVEVESEDEALAALEAGADFLLLDNRTPEELRSIAARLAGRATLEASGGIDLANVRSVAATGVQRISIGALTHSAPAADVALEIVSGGPAPGGVAA
jgi:nicotinate-nucleotide pyrophosphorylase (carboxylating)